MQSGFGVEFLGLIRRYSEDVQVVNVLIIQRITAGRELIVGIQA